MLSAFPIVIVVITVNKNKARPVMSGYHDLTFNKNHRSVSVAMAGQIRGAVNAGLDLFVTFWGDAKK